MAITPTVLRNVIRRLREEAKAENLSALTNESLSAMDRRRLATRYAMRHKAFQNVAELDSGAFDRLAAALNEATR